MKVAQRAFRIKTLVLAQMKVWSVSNMANARTEQTQLAEWDPNLTSTKASVKLQHMHDQGHAHRAPYGHPGDPRVL